MEIPQHVIDKYRDAEVDEGWWEPTMEQFIELMKEKGIETDLSCVHFSGFWSQGDGARFTGSVDVSKFFAAHPDLLDSFPYHKQMLEVGGYDDFGITIGSNDSRYFHEYTMNVAVLYDVDLEDHFDMDTPLGEWAHKELDRGLDAETAQFQEDVLDLVRDYARKLYRDLEAEYEHLTSDETVIEFIKDNDLYHPDEDEEAA